MPVPPWPSEALLQLPVKPCGDQQQARKEPILNYSDSSWSSKLKNEMFKFQFLRKWSNVGRRNRKTQAKGECRRLPWNTNIANSVIPVSLWYSCGTSFGCVSYLSCSRKRIHLPNKLKKSQCSSKGFISGHLMYVLKLQKHLTIGRRGTSID